MKTRFVTRDVAARTNLNAIKNIKNIKLIFLKKIIVKLIAITVRNNVNVSVKTPPIKSTLKAARMKH